MQAHPYPVNVIEWVADVYQGDQLQSTHRSGSLAGAILASGLATGSPRIILTSYKVDGFGHVTGRRNAPVCGGVLPSAFTDGSPVPEQCRNEFENHFNLQGSLPC